MSTTVIMISGKSSSGKGTTTDMLCRIFKDSTGFHNVIRCSLSTYIRDILMNDFYWDGTDTPESREFMAETYRLGTVIYRYHMARRVWERDIAPYLWKSRDNIVVIESFREVQNWEFFAALLNDGFIDDLITIRVNRPEESKSIADAGLQQHVSEVDLDNFIFEYIIYNSGDFDMLYNSVCEVGNDILAHLTTD